MTLKKIVTLALIIGLSAIAVILIAGLFVPASMLSKITGIPDATDGTQVIAVDANGNEITDAIVVKDEDGSTKVVDSDGKVIKDAGTSTVAAEGDNNNATKASGSTSPTAPKTPSPTPSPSPSPTPSPTPTPSPSPSPSPPPAPTPPPPGCGSGGTCTASQVATHNTQSNCWVIYNSKVYNVTGYVSKHPGGRIVFNSNTCGKNISAYLSGTREPSSGERFSHSSSDISEINAYFVANLA